MTDLKDTRPDPTRPESLGWYGRFAKDVQSITDPALVILPDLDEHHTWGPARWQARDAVTLPNEGDECMCLFDNRRQLWIPSWWTAQPPTPPDIHLSEIDPGTNGQFMRTAGGAAVWDTLTADELPAGANGQFLKTVGGVPVWTTETVLRSGDAAGGDLSGTYPNPDIAASAVGNTELAANAVTDAKVAAAAAIAISKLAGYPADVSKFLKGDGSWAAAITAWTYFEISTTGYGAGLDRFFRQFATGSAAVDLHSGSTWITAAANGNFQFPTAGTYLIGLGKLLPNATGGSWGIFLVDTSTGGIPLGARSYIGAGQDPSANLPRSGSGRVQVFTPTIGHTYSFGGFYDGDVNFSVWFCAIRLPI